MPLYRATASLLANLVSADGATGGFLTDTQATPTTWSPTITSAGGTLTTAGPTAGACEYIKLGTMCFGYASFSITDAGTGTGHIRVTAPFTASDYAACWGVRTSTDTLMVVTIAASGTYFECRLSGGSTAIANNFYAIGFLYKTT